MKNQLNYFKECKTLNDVKSVFRKLAKIHHPDIGGNSEIFKIINNEYDIAFDYFQKLDNQKQKAENIKNNKKENYGFNYETSNGFKSMIEKLLKLDNLEIEIIGSWLWFKKGSYENKEYLKTLNCRYSKSNTSWYWFEGIENQTGYKKSFYSMDKKREIYGSEIIQSSGTLKLQ